MHFLENENVFLYSESDVITQNQPVFNIFLYLLHVQNGPIYFKVSLEVGFSKVGRIAQA